MTLATLTERSAAPPVLRRFPLRRDDEISCSLEYAPGRRHSVRVRFSRWGRPGAPLRVVLGGISANRRCDRWWPQLFGAGRAFDPDRHQVLGLDWLDRHWPDGECVTTQQQAAALAAVLDHLGLERVDRLVGASYGGMVGLAFAENFPQRLAHLVAISAADRPHPAAVARRLIQRRIVRLGLAAGDGEAGLALARSLALTTYRPDSLLAERFDDEDPQAVLDELAGYFDHQGRRCLSHFDVEKYLCLSESLDHHRVGAETLRCPVDLVAVESDTLVPPRQIDALAARLGPLGRCHRICSEYGHDAFLKDRTTLLPLLGRLLAEVER